MSCFKPITAFRMENQSQLRFAVRPKDRKHIIEQLQVPCQKCIGCLLDRSNDWATRIWCEIQNWKNNCFITLTYNNDNLPENKQLDKSDLQKFWKRLRYYEQGIEYWDNPRTNKHENPIRYYSCGEYGTNPKDKELTPWGRPHYHACIFNWKPKDLKFYKYNHQGDPLYTSKSLNKIWGKGYVIIGGLNYQSACYVARYVTKKMYGEIGKLINTQRIPEFTESSRNGGIGIIKWINEKSKIVENKGIFIKIKDIVKLKPIPRFFMRKWRESLENINDIAYDEYVQERTENAKQELEKILSQTTLNESEYRKLQERNLLKKVKILVRDKAYDSSLDNESKK